MTNKIFGLLALSIFVLAFLVAGVSAENLGKWTLTTAATTQTSVSADTGINSNIVAGFFTAGLGVQDSTSSTDGNFDIDATNGATARDWDSATSDAAIIANEYYQVTITPNTGFNYVFTSISFDTIATDAMEFVIRTSEDNFASDIVTGALTTTSASISKIGLQIPAPASGVITLRIYGFNAALAADTFSIKNLVLAGDLVPSEITSCLATGNSAGNLAVDTLDLSVEEGYGEDDEWYVLDTVNIETNVEYNAADSDAEMRSIEAQWGAFDRTTNKWITDDTEKNFNLDEGDNQDINLQFKLDKRIDKLAQGNIVSYVIVTGDDKEEVSGVERGDTCAYAESSVTIKSDNTLILDSLQYPTTSVQCSESVLVTADIWNIGDDELKDTYILVNNKDLGINNQRIEVGDVNDFDNAALDFTFTVPSGIAEKSYNLLFSLYDDGDDIFEIADDESEFIVPISVSGNCGVTSPATVSANLVSGGIAGQSLVVKTTITNTGSTTANYTANAAGYAQWADTAILSETTFSLNAGQSKDVTITLAVKKTVSGEQTFNIEVVSGNQIVTTQPVSVLIESTGFLSGLTGGAIGGNGAIWAIGLINVILVIAIIMVAVRFMRK